MKNYRFYDIEENDNKIIDKIVENIIKIYNKNKNENGEIERRRKRTVEMFNYIEDSIKNHENLVLNDFNIDNFKFSLTDNIDNNKIKYIIEYNSYIYPVIQLIKTNKYNKKEFILIMKITGINDKIKRTIELEIMQDYYKNNNNKIIKLLEMEDNKIDLKIIYNIFQKIFKE